MLDDFSCQDFDLAHNTRMTTVAQLIAHLQTLPQEADVQCLELYGEYDHGARWKDLEISKDVSVVDLRGNQFVKPDSPNFGKVFVEIGDK